METATRTAKKKNKQTQGLISRKTNFAGAHFFIHYFALVLHDYNVKPPSYTFYGGNVACVSVPSCFSFSPPLIFILVAASITHRRYKIFMFFFQRNSFSFNYDISL